MIVNYKGATEDSNFYRLAEIGFDEEKELALLERMAKVLEIKGWTIDIPTDGYACCEVDNYDEYKDFVRDYKEVKKSIKNWQRFGF